MPAAARFTDVTVHAASPMVPGPGSSNVLIGNLPAWRAIGPAAAAAFVALVAKITVNVNLLVTAANAGNSPAVAKIGKDLSKQVPEAANMIAGMDQIVCPTLLIGIGGPSHGPGVMIMGSTTVSINNQPAGRVGDTIQEIESPIPNSCAVGLPTVLIGG